jgi:2-methylisocitrate lyase-like PEP mutase family enzyme
LTTAAPARLRGLLARPDALEGGRTPPIELDRLRELGFRLVLSPLTALLAATRAVQDALARMRVESAPARPGALASSAFTGVVGLPEMRRIAERFTPVAPQP